MRYRGQLASLLAAAIAVGWAGEIKAVDSVSLTDVKQRAEARGYRVLEVRWDPVLRQRWAVLESVAHPERPLVAERTDAEVSAPAVPVTGPNQAPAVKVRELAVRSGDRVILWSDERNVRMQMAATAEGDASVGDRIELLVTGAGEYGDGGWRVTGVVRGPGSVEMER